MLLRIRICHESENADEIADYFKIKDYHKRVVWRYELLTIKYVCICNQLYGCGMSWDKKIYFKCTRLK